MSTHTYTSRPYEEASDRAEYARWSKAHGVVDMPAGLLPPSGAVVVDKTGRPCAMGWVYFDSRVGFAFAAWMTTRPELSCMQSLAALEYLMGYLGARAELDGCRLLYTSVPVNATGAFMGMGFLKNHPAVGMFKTLNPK